MAMNKHSNRNRERESENIYIHGVYSIKLDNLCHGIASNESVLMKLKLTTHTATVSIQ